MIDKIIDNRVKIYATFLLTLLLVLAVLATIRATDFTLYEDGSWRFEVPVAGDYSFDGTVEIDWGWEPGADLYLHDIMDLFEQRGWNHALWAWYPASYPSGDLEGEFDFRLGSDPGNRKVQSTNTLIRTIQKNWAKNRIRPSGFQAPKFK